MGRGAGFLSPWWRWWVRARACAGVRYVGGECTNVVEYSTYGVGWQATGWTPLMRVYRYGLAAGLL